jgi:alkyldihydroxyacetonephosphate synthase
VSWANETKTPIVPYGGGSGVCGAIAAGGAVVVDLRAMDEIVDFDEKSRIVRVQPGMLGPDLDKALRSWGYMLGHEPQSVRISTVGGWIATRASGQLSARYGGIEDVLVAIEAVLPTG